MRNPNHIPAAFSRSTSTDAAISLMRLYHYSEEAGISHFKPRPSQYTDNDVVWALAARQRHKYLLPRDCPRVTYWAKEDSDPADVERLMGGTSARFVVAVEKGWLERIRACRLYVYEMPPETFTPLSGPEDSHYISRQEVEPLGVTVYDDLLAELNRCDIELRVTPSLWNLHHAAVTSTLSFSCIRLRNACIPAHEECLARMYLKK
jgi:hypothetical protein